jgi:hypothetical protein
MQSQVKRRIAFGITTGGLLAGGGLGFAHADTAGPGSGTAGTTGGSPGVLSGDNVQVPVDIPINVCGVTADVVGLLNPAAHDKCSNSGGATASGGSAAAQGSTATGGAHGSPGVLSGNNVQVPVNVPVNVCGDSLSVVGVGDAAAHDKCANHGGATATGGSGSGTGGSPGVLSGNNVQIPVHLPVNVCGDTVNVLGIGDTAAHDKCANHGGAIAIGGSGDGTTAGGSPGILSGNSIQIPIDIPVNVCGDSVSGVGVADAALHNGCANHGDAVAAPPSSPTPPSTTPPPPGQTWPGGTKPRIPGGQTPGSLDEHPQPAGATGALAHTGADGLMLAPIGAALISGGAFLYRKFKPKGSH